MDYKNLKKAIKMCGSAKNLNKYIKQKKEYDLHTLLKTAKEVNWDRKEWLKELKGKRATVESMEQISWDILRIMNVTAPLSKIYPAISWDVYNVTVTVDLSARGGENILPYIDNPYIVAQVQAAANIDEFRNSLSLAYQGFVHHTLPTIPKEQQQEKALAFVESQVQILRAQAIDRAQKMFQREYNLENLVAWKQTGRFATGALAIVGTIGSAVGAGLSVAATVLTMGGTVLGSALAVHGAVKSIVNTGNLFYTFALEYERSLDMAAANLKLIEKLCIGAGSQKATAAHLGSALLQTLVGDLAAPYDNARRQFENADYKLGKIELTLQSFGREINIVMNNIDNLKKSQQFFTQKRAELPPELAESTELKSYCRMVQDIEEQCTGLEVVLHTLLSRTSELAAPTQQSLQNLQVIAQRLVDLNPSGLAKGGGILIKGLATAATSGLAYAAKSPEYFNQARGEVNESMKFAQDFVSGFSATLSVAQPCWNKVNSEITKKLENNS